MVRHALSETSSVEHGSNMLTKMQQHDDDDDGDDDSCEENFGIDDGWSVERSCFGKTFSFPSPLRGLSFSD